ncbi:Chlorocatechol 1,2-dioxygenase [Pyrenophora tritici-repentis]|nr:Chlorocatechol 1,2-dioxygenase [Pyrenophora tritici-repentis]
MAPPKSADASTVPVLKDLTIENITENVHRINSQCADPRLKYVMERLVSHLHDFARETRLSFDEWMAGIHPPLRHRRPLPSSSTQSTTPNPPPAPKAQSSVPSTHTTPPPQPQVQTYPPTQTASPLLVLCTVKTTSGQPVPGVKVDVWETDSHGKYDVQYETRGDKADGRAVISSNDDGVFWFKGIVPVPYPIPNDGPVGKLLERLGRHCWRPSHMHFMFEKSGFDNLVTALYVRGSDYETSDAVFGVKESLIVALETVSQEQARKYDVAEGTKLLKYDFVLVTDEETKKLRHDEAVKAMRSLGREGMIIVNGLPVPDVD